MLLLKHVIIILNGDVLFMIQLIYLVVLVIHLNNVLIVQINHVVGMVVLVNM
jgi:hypothetical protein